MTKSYDSDIRKHYDAVAAAEGMSATSTMADEIIRDRETDAILKFVAAGVRDLGASQSGRRLRIVDVGCGNGYTLSRLAETFPRQDLVGFEFTESLRAHALEQTGRFANVDVRPGDIRDPALAEADGFDLLICQRVLINLLDPADQRAARDNLLRVVKPGGRLIFIEAFEAGLGRLNEARAEFGIDPLPPAHHNLYLPDDFFSVEGIGPLPGASGATDMHTLSTHYYVTRVFHEAFLKTTGTAFKRNSHFVKFFSQALPEGIGEYSPLRIVCLEKS